MISTKHNADQRNPPSSYSIRGPIIRDERLSDLFETLHHSSERAEPRLLQDELRISFADRLFARHVGGAVSAYRTGSESKAVSRAKEFIVERLDRKLGLSEIAHAVALSPYRFYRAFEREVGMTPHEFQRLARIRLSIEMIRKSQPLAEIAAATGFTDQAHFTRSFYKRLAVTPGAYRNAQQTKV
ncbi:AraC family transcriptional regulator [Rhizobium sp. LjRoot98]|uniref:helix-turn-helix domain-containing protein n=1 Tax=Rhizobium sp. LjRoot98 TaxID=3342345 RepID=UPI003ECC8978